MEEIDYRESQFPHILCSGDLSTAPPTTAPTITDAISTLIAIPFVRCWLTDKPIIRGRRPRRLSSSGLNIDKCSNSDLGILTCSLDEAGF
jgi:hypothetical protein